MDLSVVGESLLRKLDRSCACLRETGAPVVFEHRVLHFRRGEAADVRCVTEPSWSRPATGEAGTFTARLVLAD